MLFTIEIEKSCNGIYVNYTIITSALLYCKGYFMRNF